MRLSSLTPSALTGAIEARLRHARHASRRARLRRELTRLPCYVVSPQFETIQQMA